MRPNVSALRLATIAALLAPSIALADGPIHVELQGEHATLGALTGELRLTPGAAAWDVVQVLRLADGREKRREGRLEGRRGASGVRLRGALSPGMGGLAGALGPSDRPVARELTIRLDEARGTCEGGSSDPSGPDAFRYRGVVVPGRTELTLRSRDGTALHARRVRPIGRAVARLALVHGFGEHGGRYDETFAALAARGVDGFVLDVRGHGRSEGARSYVASFSDYLDDLEAFLARVEREAPGTPLFLAGHSMGGLIVTRTLEERGDRLPRLAGVVLLSPWLGMRTPPPAWKAALGRRLSSAWPSFRLSAGLNVADLSRDPAVGEAYLRDPLVVTTATSRWFTESTAAQLAAIAPAAAGTIRAPILVLGGEDDRIADLDVTRTFFTRLGAADRTLRTFPAARHELLNELDKAEVREVVAAWIAARAR